MKITESEKADLDGFDFKGVRERVGMTLAQLAAVTDFSVATINGLENQGAGSTRLKRRIKEALVHAMIAVPSREAAAEYRAAFPDTDEEKTQQAIDAAVKSGLLVPVEWKHRALAAESALSQLQGTLRDLAGGKKVILSGR